MLNINLIKPYLVYYHGNAAFEMEYGATHMGVGMLLGGGEVGVGGRRLVLSKGERIEKKSHHWEN